MQPTNSAIYAVVMAAEVPFFGFLIAKWIHIFKNFKLK